VFPLIIRQPPPFRFIYQDESGDAKSSQENFVVGLLRVRSRQPIWDAIQGVRQREKFTQELHFSKTSNKRRHVYTEVLKAVRKVRSEFSFSAIVVKNALIDLDRFSGKRYLAYNFFTRLLMEHRSQNVREAIFYADEKARIKRDNCFEYLEVAVNMGRSEGTIIKKVESMDSKTDDIMQLTDLLVGCVNNSTGHSTGVRKVFVRRTAVALGLIGDIWHWRPKK
jgi:hypothetical protein